MRRVTEWLTIFWLVMIPVSIWTHWISSVTYVAALALWSLVSGHWSGWQAARIEVKREHEEERREEVAKEMMHKVTEQSGTGAAVSGREPPDEAA